MHSGSERSEFSEMAGPPDSIAGSHDSRGLAI